MPRRAFRFAFRFATAQSNIAASSFASPSKSDDEDDAVSESSSSMRRGDAIGDTPGWCSPVRKQDSPSSARPPRWRSGSSSLELPLYSALSMYRPNDAFSASKTSTSSRMESKPCWAWSSCARMESLGSAFGCFFGRVRGMVRLGAWRLTMVICLRRRVDGVGGSPSFVFERLAWREAALCACTRCRRQFVGLSHPSVSIR